MCHVPRIPELGLQAVVGVTLQSKPGSRLVCQLQVALANRRTMFRPTAFLAVVASLVSTTWANCDCVGLDYTEGGSYLIDGYSDGLFSFTSVFEGTSIGNEVSWAGILTWTPGACFDASIVPILISPEGYGYLCSQIHSAEDGVEQVSTWYVPIHCMISIW